MKFEAKYVEENVNVSRRDHGVEFLKLALILLGLTLGTYLILGFWAELLVVRLPLGVEKALGVAFSRQIDTKKFPQTQAYAQKILDRLVADSSGLPSFEYRVDIVDYKGVNAVALPAGRIVLFRGLLEKIESEEALAFVLAHELGHYLNRDHLRGLGRGLVLMAMGMVISANGNAPNIVVPSVETLELKFSREHEQTADYFAIDTVFNVYRKVGKALDLYDILAREDRSRPQLTLFSTHPDSLRRKIKLEERIRSREYVQGAVIPLPGDGRLPLLKERGK